MRMNFLHRSVRSSELFLQIITILQTKAYSVLTMMHIQYLALNSLHFMNGKDENVQQVNACNAM